MARSHPLTAVVFACLALLLGARLVDAALFDRAWLWAREESARRAMSAAGDQYLIGVGKADITGPVVELNLMGYANGSQIGTGLRQRLYSRAFIVGSPTRDSERFIYLVLDTAAGDTAIRNGILEGLANLGAGYSMYGNQNVAVTGTHSHAGPAAWLNYLLPQVTSKGFDRQSYRAIVDGTLLSIQRAHQSLTEGRLSIGNASVADSSINRSLYAYQANPESERARYADSVDSFMTLVKFTRDSDGKDIGVLTWFPVHGTSLLGNNTIVAADNKGVAARLLEQAAASGSSSINAADGFVAGFSQANVGDTSPNVKGAWCEDGSGEMCSFENSTCGGSSQPCHGQGPYPGLNDGGTKSCFEIGRRQYVAAEAAYGAATTPLAGSVRYFHTFADMKGFTFPKTYSNGTTIQAKTCSAALGYSFAAGTTDGPGAFDFTQNDPGAPDASPLWAAVSGLLGTPSREQRECQWPKPILLNAGEQHVPYDWAPNIVDVQSFRVGQLAIIVSSGEATTMAGRRWRDAVVGAADWDDAVAVIGAPANTYAHYIATEEEYGIQRYEGASTLHGPHTLDAHINVTLANIRRLSDDATDGSPSAVRGPSPPINTDNSVSFITGVVYDSAISTSFGAVSRDVSPSYSVGDSARATFVGANPRNNLRLEATFAAVERRGSDGSWRQVRSDADWDLLFEWSRLNGLLGTSSVTVTWSIGGDGGEAVEPGTYRLRYYGDAKAAVTGRITAFTGTSAEFAVRA